jgi:hypothetical protein
VGYGVGGSQPSREELVNGGIIWTVVGILLIAALLIYIF